MACYIPSLGQRPDGGVYDEVCEPCAAETSAWCAANNQPDPFAPVTMPRYYAARPDAVVDA